MIQARPGVAASDGQTRWMNERPDFHAKTRGRRLHRRFQISSIEFIEPGERGANRFQSRFVLWHEMLRDAFGIEFELVAKIKSAVSRQFVEDPELAFAGVERGVHVFRRKH